MNEDFKKSVFVVKTFYQKNNFTSVQKAYRSEFKNEPVPSICKLKYIVSKFENTGSVARRARKKLESSEKRSEAKNSSKPWLMIFQICRSEKRILQSAFLGDLHLKPYKLTLWHKLEEHDYEKRVIFAEWFLKLPEDTKFYFICSDEAYLTLTLPINKQNNRIWSKSAPFEGIEV
jgi:hypothetical protein